MTKKIGNRCQLVGDDLFVTSVERLRKGIKNFCGNSILIKLNQIGTLSETIDTINLAKKNNFSTIGYTANHPLLIGKNDYKFYDVAYPVTELFFKSVFSQGQLTDALFTSNINRNTNFLLAFKALRSLGKYQNSLSGSKHFRFGFSFVNENLDSKLFFISQKLEKKENGGLNDASLINFISNTTPQYTFHKQSDVP